MELSKLFTSNSKLKKDGIISWDLPSIKTCPFAGRCKKGCYARRLEKAFPSKLAKSQRALDASKSKTFVDDMIVALRQSESKIVRLHASGDFYSLRYALKWCEIARSFPDRQFYAYTKSVGYFQHIKAMGKLPSNFKVIFSHGGKHDALIQTNDAQCHVGLPENRLDAKKSGYVYGNDSDLMAVKHDRIFLSYHGVNSKVDSNVFVTWGK